MGEFESLQSMIKYEVIVVVIGHTEFKYKKKKVGQLKYNLSILNLLGLRFLRAYKTTVSMH